MAVADEARRARRGLRRKRGSARGARQASRVNMCASARAMLAATDRGRWRVPRHAAVRVARAYWPRWMRNTVVVDVAGGRLTSEVCGVDCAGAMAADRAAADAYVEAIGHLTACVRAATQESRGYHALLPAGAVFARSRGRYHEAERIAMTGSAVAALCAAAVARIAQLCDSLGVRNRTVAACGQRTSPAKCS